MRIVCISDTHDFFHNLLVPDGDVLIHGGDLSRRGTLTELQASAEWLKGLPHRHKIVIGGNHDLGLERHDPRVLFGGLTYLEDQALEVSGLRIYGSPWTPQHGVWAFQRTRGEELRRAWANIPADTHLLVTHGPPMGILDKTVGGEHVGCADLLARVGEIAPGLHVFGHVHEGHGCLRQGDTLFANACNSGLGYKFLQPAQIFDWDGSVFHPLPWGMACKAGTGGVVAGPEFWETIHQRCGPPREVRYLPAEQQRQELSLGHVFWLYEVSDGYGSGDITFLVAKPGDDLLDRGTDHLHRRWAFTFGVPFEPGWATEFDRNPWERYSEVPYLPR